MSRSSAASSRAGIGGMPFLLPLLYQVGLGYTPWQSGLLLMPQALAALVTKPIAQHILARFGHRTVLIVNTVLIAGTISLFAIVGPGTPIAVLVGLGFLQGCFSSIQFTSMNSLVYADIDDTDASSASSIASTGQQPWAGQLRSRLSARRHLRYHRAHARTSSTVAGGTLDWRCFR